MFVTETETETSKYENETLLDVWTLYNDCWSKSKVKQTQKIIIY